MERLTTITAAEWYKVAEHVEAGRCEVWFRNVRVTNVFKQEGNGFYAIDTYHPRKGIDRIGAGVDAILEVRWLDTAQTERDAEVMSNHDLKMWALNMENVDDKRVLLAIDRLITENASLQAERDELARKLAAAEEKADRATTALSIARQHLGYISYDLVGDLTPALVAQEALRKMKTATPQPAPANSELVAAVKPLEDAIEHIEGLSDDSPIVSDNLCDDYHIGVITLGDIRKLVSVIKKWSK